MKADVERKREALMRLVSRPYILLRLVNRLFPASPRLLHADMSLAVRILPGVPSEALGWFPSLSELCALPWSVA